MSSAASPRAARRARRRALLGLAGVGAAVALGACASLGSMGRAAARPYVVAPSGLELPEQALRDALVAARWEAALRQAASEQAGGPSDDLLRALYRGTAAYYAGDWRASAAEFDRAAAMADDRFTKRASRAALALATNDRALPYLPGANERLFVHYYAMQAFLRRGDLDGAAVEARRLAWRLEYDGVRGDDADDRSLRATMRYLTGAVFEAAGDLEDSGVAYRNAARLAAGAALVPDTAARAPLAAPRAAPSVGRGLAREGAAGEVVLVLERGFVAHRVNDRLRVAVGPASDRWVTRAGRGDDGSVDGLGARLARQLAGDDGVWADGARARSLALVDEADSLVAQEDARADSARAERERAEASADVKGGAVASGRPAAAPDDRPTIAEIRGRRGTRGEGARPRPPKGARPAPREKGANEHADTVVAAKPKLLALPAEPPRAAPAARPRVAVRTGSPLDTELGALRWGGRVLTIAWPALARPRAVSGPLLVFAADPAQLAAQLAAPPVVRMTAASGVVGAPAARPLSTLPALAADPASVAVGDVSRALAGDFRRDRPARLARLLARAALKQSLAGHAGRKHEELGQLAGLLLSATEHADTRSWHLLPGVVEVVRLRVPAGTRPLSATVGGRVVPLGDVTVRPGAITFVTARLWADGAAPAVTGARGTI